MKVNKVIPFPKNLKEFDVRYVLENMTIDNIDNPYIETPFSYRVNIILGLLPGYYYNVQINELSENIIQNKYTKLAVKNLAFLELKKDLQKVINNIRQKKLERILK
jgi:hypothetical protein